MDFGRNFLKARNARGMDQKVAAAKLDVSPGYLSRVENGKKKPSLDLILNAAELYGVKPGFFFEDQEQIDINNIDTEENKNFIRDLEVLSNEELNEKYKIKFEGREITERELKGIKAYLHSLRSME